MIYAISTPSAQAAYNATKDIPIIMTAVTDPVEAGLVKSLENQVEMFLVHLTIFQLIKH